MSSLSVVLKIIVLIIAFCVLIAILGIVLKLAFLVVSMVGIVLCGVAAFFVFKKLFGKKGEEVEAQSVRETKLWSREGEVMLFKEEPKVHQLVDKSMANQPKKTLSVPADAEVSVLQESDIALRIKIKTGDHKGRIGWVDKASVVGYSQQQ